jgi:hypothetical protein
VAGKLSGCVDLAVLWELALQTLESGRRRRCCPLVFHGGIASHRTSDLLQELLGAGRRIVAVKRINLKGTSFDRCRAPRLHQIQRI